MENSVVAGIIVRGDEDQLRQLLLNLLDNATRYNRSGGRVQCKLDLRSEVVELIVGNSGPGIPSAARPQLFQRFFRLDAARTRGGHGLGLSLCREIARPHGGEIELTPASGDDWTEFVVRLPRN
jgi:signal transduction histidine kinase